MSRANIEPKQIVLGEGDSEKKWAVGQIVEWRLSLRSNSPHIIYVICLVLSPFCRAIKIPRENGARE